MQSKKQKSSFLNLGLYFRKAQALPIVIVLLVVIILILSLWMAQLSKNIDNANRRQMCVQSVNANELARTGAYIFAENIKCPAKQVTIAEKDNTKILSTLAEEMKECKDIYVGENGKELFKDNNIFCAPCAIVDFKTKEPIRGFYKYLAETPVPKSEVPYLNYLHSRKSKESLANLKGYNLEQMQQLNNADIDQSKTYVILFTHARGKEYIQDLMARASSASGVTFGIGTLGTVGGGILIYSLGLTNPIGWTVLGTGAIIAGSAAVYNYLFEQGAETEWMSIIFFREYTKETFKELGCTALPVEQGNMG